MPRNNSVFAGASSAEIDTVVRLLQQGTDFLATLQTATTRVKDALLEAERFRASVKRGDTVLDWKECLLEMEGFNEIAAEAASGAILERFDMGKCTLLAASDRNWTDLTLMQGIIKDFLTDRYGVKFKVRVHKPEMPLE